MTDALFLLPCVSEQHNSNSSLAIPWLRKKDFGSTPHSFSDRTRHFVRMLRSVDPIV